MAMYAAKARGKNCYEVYKPALQAAVSERLERTAELQRAVDDGEFVLHYQPIVSLDGGEADCRRGPRQVAAPRAGPAPAERVHPPGRRNRPHHPHRRMGPRGSVPDERGAWQQDHDLAGTAAA